MATVSSCTLNPTHFTKAWQQLTDEHFDMIIIGGGSVGAGTALDAATRGLKVALIEARDFAAGTSSRSSKMFHGGLRYLAMLDFRLVAESLRERELSMSVLAPHLVKPLRFIFPLTRRGWERPYMASGFMLYDLMGGAKSVPMQKHLTHKQTMKIAPGLKDDALVGGVRYYDTLVDDARHTLTVLRTAAEYGAVVRSSTQVVGFEKTGSRVTGVQLRDTDSGEEITAHADVFINATGVWSDSIEKLAGVTGKFTVHTSKGVHIVVPKSCLDADAALCFVTEKSVLFVIPWDDYWIIGTTDTPWDHNLAHPTATQADIDYLLEHINAKVTKLIKPSDIVGVYAGLRPLLKGKSDSTTNLSRNHAVAQVAPGLISVAGGKYTTYRVIGKDAVDAAQQDLTTPSTESVTEHTPLLGADGYFAWKNHTKRLAKTYGLTEEQITHLLNRYGGLITEVLAPATTQPELLIPIENAEGYLKCEAVYAVTHEGALHLEDVLHRRLRISMEYNDRGVASANDIAELIAPYLQWDDATIATEVARYRDTVAAFIAAEKELTDFSANTIATQATESRGSLDLSQDQS
jgi:hypothetical protein